MIARSALAVSFALALLTAPLIADAQPAEKVYRIGYLSIGSGTGAGIYTRPQEGFRQQLRELGWVEGRNIAIEYRFADGRADRLPGLAEELVRLKVDLITAVPTPAALAAKKATGTIPIVGMSLTEPVAVGLVASLARPGGNVTGVSYAFGTEIFGKQLEMLRDVVPKVRRVAVLANPTGSPAYPQMLEATKAAARSLALELQLLEVYEPTQFDGAFAAMAKERAGALLVMGHPLFFHHRARLADLAAKHRLPSMSTQEQWVDAGGLMSYGPNFVDIYRRGAVYVDRILKGAKPGDLPIEQPTNLALVLNLKTAKRLGLTIPPTLRERADQVIE
jgi:putative tryptophan/tyrosine transport system substrate-binding protein